MLSIPSHAAASSLKAAMVSGSITGSWTRVMPVAVAILLEGGLTIWTLFEHMRSPVLL